MNYLNYLKLEYNATEVDFFYYFHANKNSAFETFLGLHILGKLNHSTCVNMQSGVRKPFKTLCFGLRFV